MLHSAKNSGGGGGAQVMKGSIKGFAKAGDVVTSVQVALPAGEVTWLDCDDFVNAAGAWTVAIDRLLQHDGPALPLKNELHVKVCLDDPDGVIPQDDAPFMVWRDTTPLLWDDDDREGLAELDDTAEGGFINSAKWLDPQPGGQHLRPAGKGRVLLLWEHLHRHVKLGDYPSMPIDQSLDMYPELCLAGLAAMVPKLRNYYGRLSKSTTVDGGYYTVTPDGRPLVGQHGASNAFICGGMGTYGCMGAPAAGELVAMHVCKEPLPSYAPACTWPRLEPLVGKPVDLLDASD